MTSDAINERIRRDECEGEMIVNVFRIVLAVIFVAGLAVISFMRGSAGYGRVPVRGYIFPVVFLLFSIFLLFYLRSRKIIGGYFKYICVTLDAFIISASIWGSCTYFEAVPPITFLSVLSLFYFVLIMCGSFRYDENCALFSGVVSGALYAVVIIANRGTLDMPYTAIYRGSEYPVFFPVYNETFRIMGMIVAGSITAMASKRRLALFNTMIEKETAAAEAASKTVEQTRSMSKTIQKTTNEIFLSSKDIFTTANNQAASVQEIESTINENTQIATEIADKTGSVATIASKMEEDVIHGFTVLENNVTQMEAIKSKNENVISGIILLGNKITKIRDIVKTINTITDQTKVIAFNAALEAASAGERGKRFSVVASEVNRLADDIAALTKQIRDQVEEIQDSSSSLIISSEESADKITEGNKLIKELEDIFREIRSGAEITANQAQTITVSTQRQQKSTEQINIAIADISSGLNNFIHSTEVATSSAEGLTRMIKELGMLLDIPEGVHGD
jgi:methyl-accepting chemotaxis protein